MNLIALLMGLALLMAADSSRAVASVSGPSAKTLIGRGEIVPHDADDKDASTSRHAARPDVLKIQGLAWGKIAGGRKFENTEIGGLSGILWTPEVTKLISDDRGRKGEPRFYEASVRVEAPRVKFEITAVRFLRETGSKEDGPLVLDNEGLAASAEAGEMYVSSEADTNRHPRRPNRLMRVASDGRILGDVVLPAELQPEPTGRQTRGTRNNAGLEALTWDADGPFLVCATERPLEQDARDAKLARVYRGRPAVGGALSWEPSRSFEIGSHRRVGAIEVFRGVSAMLSAGKGRYFFLERAVQLKAPRGIAFEVDLVLTDCAGEGACRHLQTWHVAELAGKLRGETPTPNWEGLSWGPEIAGSRTLLFLSDNNFEARDASEILAVTVKEP